MADIKFTPQELKSEDWRDIPGYEGHYQISDLGRIKSLQRWDSLGRIVKERFLNQRKEKNGYIRIYLYDGGGMKTRQRYLVHRLIAQIFIGPCPKGYQVNHKNSCRYDNRAGNLEYVIHAENIRLGKLAKLSKEDVRKIRKLLNHGITQRAIAKKYSVDASTISGIVIGRTWAGIE